MASQLPNEISPAPQAGIQHEKSTSTKATVQNREVVTPRSDSDAENGNMILTEADCPGVLSYEFPTRKKWWILCIIFLVQCSMNFNASLYANGQPGIEREFGVAEQVAANGAALFLVLYALGCELWAPWSEEFGRWPIMQLSLGLVNLMALPVALAQNTTSIFLGRSFGGIFSAGGSITLGIVADLYRANDQQYAVAFVALSSVGGSIFGPIIGGFVEEHMHWRWSIWLQLIVGIAVQLLHGFFVPETRTTSLLDIEAKRLRAAGNPKVYGPNELKSWRECLAPKALFKIWMRPFVMFVTEPIVLVLSSLSGFSDALIFMGFQSFGEVYKLWGFTSSQIGLTFVAIGLGYLISYLSFFPAIKRNMAQRAERPDSDFAKYESRLWWLMYTAPCLPIGLLIFAWTSTTNAHWVGPVIGSAIIGIANYAVYMATIDYMVAVYGEYAASATGGNGFARDLLAGLLTWAARPYYDGFKSASPEYGLQLANTTLAIISLILVAATFWVYFKGPELRKRSSFAQELAVERPHAAAAHDREQRSHA